MPLNPNDPTVETAIFGESVRQFLRTPIGEYLMSRAKDQAEDALSLLAEADPEDPKKIRDLQNKIRVADSITDWLSEAIRMGDQALQQLREEQ